MDDAHKTKSRLLDELAELRQRITDLEALEVARRETERELRARERQQEVVARLGLTALAGAELDALMDEAVARVAETLDMEYCKVLELLPDGKALLLRAGVGWKEGLVGQATVGRELDSQAGYTLASSAPVIVEDLRTETRFSGPSLLLEHGVVSGMSVIIQDRDCPWGVLGVHTKQKRIFTQDDIYFIQAVANVLAETISRKRAENALRRSEHELHDFFENAPLGLHWVGPDGVILRVNQAELDMLGYSREEYIGRHIAEFHADAPVIEDILRRLSAGETLQNYEARLRCKDGTIRHVRINKNVLWEDGRFIHTRCFTRDITNQKKAEEVLLSLVEASRELSESLDYRETLDRVAGLVVPDLADWCIVDLVQENGSLDRVVVRHADPEKRELAEELQRRYPPWKKGSGAGYEVMYKGRSRMFSIVTDEMVERVAQDAGHLRLLQALNLQSVILAPLEAHGRVLGVLTLVSETPGRYGESDLALVTDLARRCAVAVENARLFQAAQAEIAERERMQESLREREERFRSVVETVVDGILAIDEWGAIEFFNPAAERLFGYKASEVIGKKVNVLMPEPYQSEHDGYISRYKETGEARVIGIGREVVARRKDGTIFPMDLAVSEFHLGDRRMFTGIIRDITKRKQAETEREAYARDLARSNEELQLFAYVASHDLREPLRMVSNYMQLLEQEYRGRLDAEAEEYIRFAVDGAERMQRLIDDLLDYSRLGTHGKAFAPVDVEKILDRVRVDLKLAIEESGTEIIYENLPTVEADETQLVQVFQNLISNAIKFRSDRPPRIHIAAKRKNAHYRFCVSDNGIGIAPQFSERIFTIFQRLHAREEYTGTGIGLAMCKKIIERHGGRIWVESDLGKGATFCFTLPFRSSS